MASFFVKRLSIMSLVNPITVHNLTLLHKLEAEGKLINQPISSLGDESFVQLIKWLGKQKGKNGKGVNPMIAASFSISCCLNCIIDI